MVASLTRNISPINEITLLKLSMLFQYIDSLHFCVSTYLKASISYWIFVQLNTIYIHVKRPACVKILSQTTQKSFWIIIRSIILSSDATNLWNTISLWIIIRLKTIILFHSSFTASICWKVKQIPNTYHWVLSYLADTGVQHFQFIVLGCYVRACRFGRKYGHQFGQ